MIESLHAAELEQIVSLQRLPVSALVMKALSNLGPSAYLLGLVGLVYLCFDSRFGARLLLLYVGAQVVSHFSKLAFHLPRPFWLDERVQAFEPTATSFGLPSGHSLVATCVWLLIAIEVRKWWFWASSCVIILLVSLSRVWLGSHFISDVLGGCLLGGFVLLFFLWGEKRWQPRLCRLSFAKHLGLTVIFTLVIVAVGFTIRATLANSVDVAQWPRYPGARQSYRSLGAYSGTFLGLGIGLAMALRWAHFNSGGPILQRALRLLLVAAPALLYWLRPRGLLKELADLPAFLLLFTGCALAAWGFTFALPWVLLRIRLADPMPASAGVEPSNRSERW